MLRCKELMESVMNLAKYRMILEVKRNSHARGGINEGVHLAGMLRAVNEALQVSDPLIPVFEYLLGAQV